MKISFRILLINFLIVALILGSSAVAFYTIMYNVLTSQQSKYLLNSANDFIFNFRELNQNLDDEFLSYIKNGKNPDVNPNWKLDFIFKENPINKSIYPQKINKDMIYLPNNQLTIKHFMADNPYTLIKKYKNGNGVIYYYGKSISPNLLDELSRTVNAEIAIISNDSPAEISNESVNQKLIFFLTSAYKDLRTKNNFEIYSGGTESNDILATICRTSGSDNINNNLQFMVFNTIGEAAILRASIKNILLILGISGVLLSLILTFVFTDKLRKQITQLSKGTEITRGGDFKNRIPVQSKDELGHLAIAFNEMMDEIEKNQKAKTEYSEFITLINQNPTLKEISDAALKKIISTCNLSTGSLYTVNEHSIKLISSFGFDKDHSFRVNSPYFSSVVNNREVIEISSDETLPVISTGAFDFKLKYILIIPIVYNNKTIAVLELGSFEKLSEESKDYLSKIKDQLAIGLTNATALLQLENLVSELKKLNEDYQKQNEQIKEQHDVLVELHKELKQQADELEIQKEKAEEATKLKSQFLASMSHELRTPMNSILGLTELILDRASLDSKNRERLEVVLKSGRRLMNLINDILDLSKIEAGKMDIQEDEILLNELLEDVEHSISPLLSNKQVEFKIERETNTNVYIITDRGKITQVLINLLGNAVKFTEKGYINLRVSSESNALLKFEVIDTGIGISEEHQKAIFEEFRQVDGTTTRKYSGTGLGLAICKRIADLLKGSLSVQSYPGKGSTFTFSIPLNFLEMRQEEGVTAVNVAKLIKNRKNPILVIDDDSEIRYTIGQYLNSRGYEVVYAEDGAKGIELAKQIQPFAITLDVMLPNKDGWSVLKDLKEDDATKDIPVILISIMGEKNVGYGLGAFEYFIKPISHDKLLSAFSRLENLAKKKIEKIVLVDDDELEFEKFKKAFKNDKVRIEYIKDSELAFSKISETQPDLIILDLMMPKIDGITLSHKLKSHPETKHIPVIISTAKDLTDEEQNSLNNTVEDITVKSNGHPLDVLKVVRDRLKMHEDISLMGKIEDKKPEENNIKDNEMVIDETKVDTEDSDMEFGGEILIADDDPDALFTISEIIGACGYKTIMANGGEECLNILESKTPDMIFLDIMMPVLDGFQVLKKIKKIKRLSHVPVFAVTAKAMSGDKDIILKNGFDDYIAKPVNAGIMAFKIEKIFSKLKST